jgi:hypothetical protein
MADLKTKRNDQSVGEFINGIADVKRRQDCQVLTDLMGAITGAEPAMWGSTIVGFGNHHYRYESGREGDWFLTGFSPRKQYLALYLMSGFAGQDKLMRQLGKYKTGKSCLYVNKLEDVDFHKLKELITRSVRRLKDKHS